MRIEEGKQTEDDAQALKDEASEKRAMLVLNNYVIGVYEEMGDALEQMQWRSLATLRDLCDAAMEGGAPTPQRDATRHNLHAEAAPFAAQERSG